ncbi:cyclin family protein [Striga asiatica]|uniref:Cyclin family protein n=1 Tax=Striga asiatica TaxID=4170 RepID=A0A5A7RHG5_STRAF|nr:cyclin family protein [Striga asiatica]
MEFEAPLLNLFCNEDISSLDSNLIEKDDDLDFISVSEPDCDYIENSFRKEIIIFRSNRDQNEVKRWPQSFRLEAVKSILKISAMFGYHYRTAYLSSIYLDQFLAKTWFSDGNTAWTSRLLSIACLSLAAKMEEHKARKLIEYRVDGYGFEGIAIQKMELCVLHELGWQMGILTPFTYIHYFTAKLCAEKCRQKEIATRAADLVLAIMEEPNINAAENLSSIVAAASVLAAYDHRLEKRMMEDKINEIPSWGSLEKDLTFSCYCKLQEIMMLKTPKSAISPSWISADDSTAITSKGGSKRRLNFDNNNNNDQNCPTKKNC